MTPWLLVTLLSVACIVLALRLAAEAWYSRSLRQLVTDMIEEELVEQTDDAITRGIAKYSAEKAAREVGGWVVKGGVA